MYEIHCNDRPVSTGISSVGDARGWLAWHLDHASAEDPTGTLGRHADTLKALITTAAASAVFCLGADDFRIVPVSDNLIAPAYAIGVYHRDRSWLDDREVSQKLCMILPARTLREMHALRRRMERQVDDEHQAVHALYRNTSGQWSERGRLPISEDEPF
jgi:hypothetical protein